MVVVTASPTGVQRPEDRRLVEGGRRGHVVGATPGGRAVGVDVVRRRSGPRRSSAPSGRGNSGARGSSDGAGSGMAGSEASGLAAAGPGVAFAVPLQALPRWTQAPGWTPLSSRPRAADRTQATTPCSSSVSVDAASCAFHPGATPVTVARSDEREDPNGASDPRPSAYPWLDARSWVTCARAEQHRRVGAWADGHSS